MSKQLHLRELILLLVEDAKNIEQLVSSDKPPPSLIRSTVGPILRRWICEGDFNVVQKALRPILIKFYARKGPNDKQNLKHKRLGLWVGPIQFGEVVFSLSVPASEGTKVEKHGSHSLVELTSKSFFKQDIFFVKDQLFSRVEAIKFYVNELGGAHFDYSKISQDDARKLLKDMVGFEVGKSNSIRMLVGSEISDAKANPEQRPSIYDLTDLIALDTASIFARGILANLKDLEAVAVTKPVTAF